MNEKGKSSPGALPSNLGDKPCLLQMREFRFRLFSVNFSSLICYYLSSYF